MNDAHLHLLINHFPIILPMVGATLLIIGLFTGAETLKRAACGLFVVGAITSFMAFHTGEEAEEIVEELPQVSHETIHDHEEEAETFAILSYSLAGLSLVAFWMSWKSHAFQQLLMFLVLLLSFIVVFYAVKTGSSGGKILHLELIE